MKRRDIFSDLASFLFRCRFIYFSHKLLGAVFYPVFLLGLFRLADHYLLFSPPFLSAGYGLILAGLVYKLTASVVQLPMSGVDFVNNLIARDKEWEVVRVALDHSGTLSGYYEDRLGGELKDFISSKKPAGILTIAEKKKLFLSVVVVLLVVVLGWLPAREIATGKPAYENWKLKVSSPVVLAGDTVTVSLVGSEPGRKPDLLVKEKNKDYLRRVDWATDNKKPTWRSFPLENNLQLYLSAGDWRERRAGIKVVKRPRITSVSRRIYPPDYTNLPVRDVEKENIKLYPGSSLRVRVETSRVLENLKIFDKSGETLAEESRSNRLEHTEYMLNPGIFQITGRDSYGFKMENYSYRVNMKGDPPPELTLLEPEENKKVPGSGLLSVRVKYNDRFGLSGAGIEAWRSSENRWNNSLAVPDRQPEGEIYGHIDLDELELLPGEKFKFSVYARDLDNIRGPKQTEIGPFELQVRSWGEMMARQEQTRSRSASGLQKMSRDVSRLRKEIEDLRRTGEADDWETTRRLQKIQKNLQQKEKKLKQVQQDLENYSKSSPGLSGESLQRLGEIQSMVKEYGLDGLQKSQEELKKQLDKDSFSGEDLQHTDEQLKKFEEDIRRTHDYLENIKPALELDRMARSLEQMASEQEQFSEVSSEEKKRLLEKQGEQWEWMQKKIQEMKKQTSGDISKQLKEMQDLMKKNQPARKAQSLAENPSEKKLDKYQQQTEEFQQKMSGLTSRQFSRQDKQQRSLQEKLVDFWTNWYYALQNWSRRVDRLEVPPRFLAQYGAELNELHGALEGLTTLRKGWGHLAATTRRIAGMDLKFPREIVNVLDKQEENFDKINKWMNNRRIRRVNNALPGLMEEQAEFIHKFLEWESSQSSSGGGGSPSLEQMLSGQRQLQQQMMPLFNQQSVSPQMARRMAQQQQMIKQGLRQIAGRAGQNEETLGDLEALVESMKKAEKKMKKREFDAQLRQRQEKIMDRLEQATKAIDKEGAEKKRVDSERKSTTGLEIEAEREISDYQEIMNKISKNLEELSPAEREAVIRYYRFFYRQEDADRE